MNYYQKVFSLITSLAVIMTLAILFVCFSTPFSIILITEVTAIAAAEILLGIACIHLCAKQDPDLPYSLGLLGPFVLYFVFSLIMIWPASGSIPVKHFILIHSGALAATAVFCLIFAMGRHSLKETGLAVESAMQVKKMSIRKMQELLLALKQTYPNEHELLHLCAQTLDDLRFSPVSPEAAGEEELKILDILTTMQEAQTVYPVSEYKMKLQKIRNVLTLKERM